MEQLKAYTVHSLLMKAPLRGYSIQKRELPRYTEMLRKLDAITDGKYYDEKTGTYRFELRLPRGAIEEWRESDDYHPSADMIWNNQPDEIDFIGWYPEESVSMTVIICRDKETGELRMRINKQPLLLYDPTMVRFAPIRDNLFVVVDKLTDLCVAGVGTGEVLPVEEEIEPVRYLYPPVCSMLISIQEALDSLPKSSLTMRNFVDIIGAAYRKYGVLHEGQRVTDALAYNLEDNAAKVLMKITDWDSPEAFSKAVGYLDKPRIMVYGFYARGCDATISLERALTGDIGTPHG